MKGFSAGTLRLIVQVILAGVLYQLVSEFWVLGAKALGFNPKILPGYVIPILAVGFFFFRNFFWHKVFKPLIAFLLIAPAVYFGLRYGFKFLGVNLANPTVLWSLKIGAITISLYLAAVLPFLLKKIFMTIASILFWPFKFIYKLVGAGLMAKIVYYFKYGRYDKCPIDLSLNQIDAFGKGDSYEKGRIFEAYVAEIYKTLGMNAYTTTEMRQMGKLPPSIQQRGGSGEQGVDVIVEVPQPDGSYKLLAIQCKHYSKKVDNGAIQEINTALSMYNAQHGVVITNNYFTKPAKELAEANGVTLIDRDRLASLVKTATEKFYQAKNQGETKKQAA